MRNKLINNIYIEIKNDNKGSLMYRIKEDVLDHLSVLKAVDGLDFLFGTKTSNKFLYLFSYYRHLL